MDFYKCLTWFFSNSFGPEVGEPLPHPEVGCPQQSKEDGSYVKQHFGLALKS